MSRGTKRRAQVGGGIPPEWRKGLTESGPGTVVAMSINHRTALLVLVAHEAEVQYLRGPVLIEVQEQAHILSSGVAVRLAATVHVAEPVLIESFLNPASPVDVPLLEALTRQETFEIYFFVVGQFDRPCLAKQIHWPAKNRQEAAAILKQVRQAVQERPGSFAAAKEQVLEMESAGNTIEPAEPPSTGYIYVGTRDPAMYSEALEPRAEVVDARHVQPIVVVTGEGQPAVARRLPTLSSTQAQTVHGQPLLPVSYRAADALRQHLAAYATAQNAVVLFRDYDDGCIAVAALVPNPHAYIDASCITCSLHVLRSHGVRCVQIRFHFRFPGDRGEGLLGSAHTALVPSTASMLRLLSEQDHLTIHFFAAGRHDVAQFSQAITWTEENRRDLHNLVDGIGADVPPAYQPLGLRPLPWTEKGGRWSLSWEQSREHDGAFLVLVSTSPTDVSLVELCSGVWKVPSAAERLALPTAGLYTEWLVCEFKAGEQECTLYMMWWPRSRDPFEALLQLVEEGRQKGTVVPWQLVSAIYAALRSRQAKLSPDRWSRVVHAFLTGQDQRIVMPGAPVPPLAKKEVAARAERWTGDEAQVPRNPYTRAVFYWAVGRRMWTATALPLDQQLLDLAEAVAVTQPHPLRVVLSPSQQILAEADDQLTLWRLWLISRLLTKVPIAPNVLDFILPRRTVSPQLVLVPIEHPWGGVPWDVEPSAGEAAVPLPPRQAFVRAWAETMRREADEHLAYVPVGWFRLPVPPDSYLAVWGCNELRVSMDREGMWVGLVTADGRVVSIARWTPDLQEDLLLVPPWAHAALDLICSCVWRDARTHGPAVLPRVRKSGRRGRKKAPPRELLHPVPTAQAAPRVLRLPRRRHRPAPATVQQWELGSGSERDWGSPDERRRIRERVATPVSPHYRRWVHKCEVALAALLAVLGTPPVDTWRSRLRAARDEGYDAEMFLWSGLLSAAGSAQRIDRGEDRVEAVAAVLRGLQEKAEREPHLKRLHFWAGAGLQALERAADGDIEDLADQYLTERDALRAASDQRALEQGLPPAPDGEITVRGWVPQGRTPRPEEAPVVQAKGLLIAAAVLRATDAAAAPPAADTPEEPESEERATVDDNDNAAE